MAAQALNLLMLTVRMVTVVAFVLGQVSGTHAKPGTFAQPQPQGRLAFVVGNSTYRHIPSLKNATRDSRLMAETLRGLGFDVVEATDLTHDEKRFVCFAAVALADAVEPMVSMKEF